jgi:type II secretory pathway component PulF
MSRYQYRAVDGRGNIVDGETTATSTGQAIAQLERQGLQVQSISFIDSSLEHLESLTSEEQNSVVRIRQHAVHNAQLWSAPLLALSQEVKSRWLANFLSKLSRKLRDATSIEQLAGDSETAEVLPFVIKDLDSTSESDSWLMKLTQQLESRRKHVRALLYPIVSIVFLSVILVAGAIWIIPTFRQMFDEFGLTLPAPTKLVFTVSNWIYPHTLRTFVVLAVFIGAVIAIVGLIRRSVWLLQHFPALTSGSRSGLRAMGLISQNAAELVQLQYPLAQALRMAAQGCNHFGYRAIVARLADEVETAGAPHSAQTKCTLPPLLLGTLSSGTADVNALRRIGAIYRDRERDGSRQFAIILSQLTVAAAGLIIGLVIIALFMPLVRLVTALA